MWQVFNPDDEVLEQEFFLADEVPYNWIHHIIDSADAVLLKMEDHRAVFAQSPGQNAWLWMSPILAHPAKRTLMQELVQHLKMVKHPPLCGITGERSVAELFATCYNEVTPIHNHMLMGIVSYSCTQAQQPVHVRGELIKPSFEHIDIIAQYMSGFASECFDVEIKAEDYISAAVRAVGNGNTYLWVVDGSPVATANIAHRSPRYARINGVYTVPDQRNQGYAGAAVAAICTLLQEEQRIAMLYAGTNKSHSNRAYQNIGFAVQGQVVDIRFSPLSNPFQHTKQHKYK